MKRTRKLFSVILANILVIICLAPMAQTSQGATIKASIMVIGDARHAAGAHSQYQVWMDKTTYTLPDNAIALDLIDKALKAAGMKYVNPSIIPAYAYLSSVTAPAVLGSYTLKAGIGGNGADSGWMVSTDKSGRHELTPDGIGEYQLSDGEFIVVHYIDNYNTEIQWSADWLTSTLPASWLDAAPLPVKQGGSGSGGGGTGGSGIYTPNSGTTQNRLETPKEYSFSDLKNQSGTNIYQLAADNNSAIKAGALKDLPAGSVLYAEIKSGDKIQFRIKFPTPSDIDVEIKTGMGFTSESNGILKLFKEHFKNKLQMLAFNQTAPWGQTVEVTVNPENISGFDAQTWKLYSYDAEKNLYAELAYYTDANGYIYFSASSANPVIFSDGALAKR